MDFLKDHEAIREMLRLMEENNRQDQAQEFSRLIACVDSMEQQYAAVLSELRDVKQQLAEMPEQRRSVKDALMEMVQTLENRVGKMWEQLQTIRDKIISCAKDAVSGFKQMGTAALDTAVYALGIKNLLESVQDKISTPPQDTQQTPPAETTAPAAGEPLSVGSEFFTRDLLYNKDTHKQFITVEGRDGNIFYIVIDYDAPVNEDEEQYQTYFLNKVDEADLSALVEQGEPAAYICTDKCHAGAVNTACPVCSVNMTECAGKESEPEKQEEPAGTDTEPDPEPEKKGGVNGMLIVVLATARPTS